MNLPKLILTDIDGVWTDGSMYYSSSGEELKRFNTYDSAGVLLCRTLNIPVGILTGEDSPMVKRRAEKLNIPYCYTGVTDKLKIATELALSLGITLSETAYIGDDINDIELLKAVGYPASVPNAARYIQSLARYITSRKGGEGAFRDFIEHILTECNCLQSALSKL